MNGQVQKDSWMEGFRGVKVWSALLAWERKERRRKLGRLGFFDLAVELKCYYHKIVSSGRVTSVDPCCFSGT